MPHTFRASQVIRTLLVLAALFATGLGSPAQAFDFGGAIRVFWTTTDSFGVSSQSADQRLRLGLSQELSPYLSVTLNHSHNRLRIQTENSPSFTRRLEQPQARLVYSRPKLSASLGYNYRWFDSTVALDAFEAYSVDANMSWQARPSLTFNLNLRDDVNETDVSALGRETETRVAQASVRLDRRLWYGRYQYSHIELQNSFSNLQAKEDRHDLQLDAGKSFFANRLELAFRGLLGYSERSQVVGENADLAEPIPAVEGLFAIEVNPALVQLEPFPALIDGDFVTPVSPPIDIGAANTFRNLGLDLGITRPISRLEIAVDQPSGPGVQWQVYQSRDNLFWEPVSGAQSRWNPDLLRYEIFFPETENQFFKAVNVSVNAANQALVTEIRALRDLSGLVGEDQFESELYRVDASAAYRFTSRIRAGLNFGARNDQTTVAGLVRQDRQSEYAAAGLDIGLTDTLALGIGYRWADTQEDEGTPSELDRTTTNATANLRWTPLTTGRVVLAASSRDEFDKNELLQSTQTTRLGASLDLLDDLTVTTSLDYSRLDDPFSESARDSYGGTLGFRSRPRRRWELRGGYSHRLNESFTGDLLVESTSYWLATDWAPTNFISLLGEARLNDNNGVQSLRQNYGLTYSPGPKLAITSSWNELDSDSGRLTGGSQLSASYRLYRRVIIFGTLSRSRTRQNGILTSEINSAQIGLTIEF